MRNLMGAALILVGSCLRAPGQSVSFTEFPVPTFASQPGIITTGPDGALWFTEYLGTKIGRLTTTGTISEFLLPTANSGPGGIAVGPDGALWFTESGSKKIGRITTAGALTEFSAPAVPSLITAGPDGALWFTESPSTIGRITTTGAVTEFPLAAGSQPWAITAGPDGALWFTEQTGNKIGRITTNGAITEYSLPTANSQPYQGITAGPDGALWFVEYAGNQIGRITTGGVITEFPVPGGGGPFSIATGPDAALWFTLYQSGKIGRITISGVISLFPLPTANSSPQGITNGPDGALWIAEGTGGGGNKIARALPGSGLSFVNALRIAQIADGASWKTSFQVVNLDQTPVSYSFQFWGDNGSPLQLPILNGSAGTFSGTLAVGGTAIAETPGSAVTLLQGWAEVASSGRIGVLTIFRQSVSGRPDSEGTVTGVQSSSRVFLPFDNTNGYTTGVAVANTNATQLFISLAFLTDGGAISTGSLSLPPHAHTAFVLTSMFPAVAGVLGSIQFTASTPDIAVVGLRFSPTNSFTSLGEFQ